MKIKLCGLTRPCDIEAVNELQPDYIGFVFAKKSRRYVSPEKAEELKAMLAPGIQAAGDPATVFSGRRTGYGEPRDGKSETKSIWHRCQFRH